MCGRFVQYSAPEVYAERFKLELELTGAAQYRPRYNIAPTQPVLVVRQAREDGRELVVLRWGLVPAWSKGPDNRYSMINARAETVATKPAYRSAFKQRRCLIPADGFYEWQARPGSTAKQPYLVARQDGEPLAFAGLWEHWGEGGEAIESCTIIVTDANEQMRPIHDRMPVLLAPANCAQWLDLEFRDTDRLHDLLKPTAVPLTLRPVSARVNSPRNDGPELLQRVEVAGGIEECD